jgi:HD superfamily phosphodiesterase
MKDIFEYIWQMALPYQDKRDDKGHAEITLHYATRLVELENGDEDIVIPAIILHDVGYSQLTREVRLSIFDKDVGEDTKLSVRLQHQDAGVELAREILDKVGYPADLTAEILEIISQHDTREGFISRNEGLVRDADKLWRFSEAGFAADERRYGSVPQLRLESLADNIDRDKYFYSESARQIARKELELSKKRYGPPREGIKSKRRFENGRKTKKQDL